MSVMSIESMVISNFPIPVLVGLGPETWFWSILAVLLIFRDLVEVSKTNQKSVFFDPINISSLLM